MNKFFIAIIVFLMILLGILFFMYNYTKTKISYLESEKNALKGNIMFLEKIRERERQDSLEISRRNAELEQEAQLDKSFNWYLELPASSSIVKQLHKDKN